MPQNEVISILPDKNQFLWIATQNGLTRFDGQRMVIFGKSQFPMMGSNRIANLLTENQSLYFRTSADPNQWYTIASNSYDFAAEMKTDSGIWISSQIQRFFVTMTKPGQMDDRNSNHLFNQDVKENFYINFKSVPGNTRQFRFLRHRNYYYQVFKNNQYKELKIQNWTPDFYLTDTLYGRSDDGEFIMYHEGVKHRLEVRMGEQLIQPAIFRKCLIFFTAEGVFVQYLNKLYRLRLTEKIAELEYILDLESEVSVQVVYYWKDHNMYLVGTPDNGFYVYREKLFSHAELPAEKTNGSPRNIFRNIFYAVLPLPDNQVLTAKGIFTANGFYSEKITSDNEYRYVLMRDGSIYYSRMGKLYHLAPGKGEETEVAVLRRFNGGMTELADLGICWTGRDAIYFIKNKVPAILTKLPKAAENPNFIFGTSDYRILISASGHLFEYDIKRKKYYRYKSFEGVTIRQFYEESDGVIWLGSYGDGWYKMHGNSIIKLPEDRSGFLKVVNGIIRDKNGYMWISTNTGLFRFLYKDLLNYKYGNAVPFYNYFNFKYGFESDEFNGGCIPSIAALENGSLVFPSLKGLVFADVAKMKPEEFSAPIFIDYLRAGGEIIPGSEEWRLAAGSDVISIAVASPYWGNPYNLQIEYRFNGPGEKWIPLPEDGRIRLLKTASGTLQITLRRQSGFGKDEFIEKTIKITIESYWYQSRWFAILIIILVILGVYLFVIFRLRRVNAQRHVLKETVQERTIEIRRQNEELKLRIEEVIRNREALRASNLLNERLMASLAHDIRSPLKFQLQASEFLVRLLNGTRDKELLRIAEEIEKNTAGMYHFTGDILAWQLSVNEKQKFEKDTVKLSEITAKCIGFLQFAARMNQNTFVNLVPEESEVETVVPIVEIVIRNLLDNSNKNARNGTISVEMIKDAYSCGIRISDTGNGMRPEEVLSLNNFYKNLSDSATPGFGSYMLRDFVNYLGAEINYKSSEGVGTTVFMRCFYNPAIKDSVPEFPAIP